jgi:hypothetical protein
MGGFGSTRWSWVSTKDMVEDSRSLDINKLNKAGCLRPGYWGGWQWTRDGERVAWIELRRNGNLLRLSYRFRQHGGDWQDVEQSTAVVWFPCRFGGARPYFICPGIGEWNRLWSPGDEAIWRCTLFPVPPLLSPRLCLAARRSLR